MFGFGAQVAAEYDKNAPHCPRCGMTMYFQTRLGGVVIWDCSECDEQIEETVAAFGQRTRKTAVDGTQEPLDK
jgi:ribosomal protein L37AE/L43A